MSIYLYLFFIFILTYIFCNRTPIRWDKPTKEKLISDLTQLIKEPLPNQVLVSSFLNCFHRSDIQEWDAADTDPKKRALRWKSESDKIRSLKTAFIIAHIRRKPEPAPTDLTEMAAFVLLDNLNEAHLCEIAVAKDEYQLDFSDQDTRAEQKSVHDKALLEQHVIFEEIISGIIQGGADTVIHSPLVTFIKRAFNRTSETSMHRTLFTNDLTSFDFI